MEKLKKKLHAHRYLCWSLLGLGLFFVFLGLLFFAFINSLPGKLTLIYLNQPTTNLANSNNRTNIVILGLGGNENTTQDLTDTMIFVSLNHSGGEPLMLSLPRDLWLESMKAKINTAYHYGRIDLVKSSVEEVLGQEIHYVFLLDFNGFERVIDLLGGLEINVENSFDDFWFPIPGKENDPCGGDPEYKCRYEHVHFDAGWQTLDSGLALKYVRSRNAEGDEGTDFARVERQQNLILALKNNLLTTKVLFDLNKLRGLLRIAEESFATDIEIEEYPLWAKLMLSFEKEKINSQVLNGEHGLLYHPLIHYSGQWVVLPRDPSWKTVYEFIEGLI